MNRLSRRHSRESRFSWRLAARWLGPAACGTFAGLILFSVSTTPARAQETPAPAPPARPAEGTPPAEAAPGNLDESQASLERRYQQFERTLLQMAEYLRKTEPERADLLIRAIGRSKETRISQQMDAISQLLKKEQFGDAIGDQQHLVADLKGLLELLESEDRRHQLEQDKQYYEELHKEISKLSAREKEMRRATERGGNLNRLGERQGGIGKDAQSLLDKIDKEDAKRNGSPNQPNGDRNSRGKNDQGKQGAKGDQQPGDKQSKGDQQSKEDKQSGDKDSADKKSADKNSDGKDSGGKNSSDKKSGGKNAADKKKSGDQKSGDQKTGDKKSDDQKNDDKKQDGDEKKSDAEKKADADKKSDKDAKNGEKQSGEQGSQNGDKKKDASQSQRDKSQKQQGQGQQSPQNGEQGEQNEQPQEGSPSEDSQPQELKPKKTPGRTELDAARRAMRQAEEELKRLEGKKGMERQDEAIRKLAEARAQLEKILRQLRQEEQQIILASLEARFKKMLIMQQQIHEDTLSLSKTATSAWTVKHFSRSRDLSVEESVIADEAEKALKLLKEEGSSVAFPQGVEQVRDDMMNIAHRLSTNDVGEFTQSIERDVIESLQEMVTALENEIEKRQKQDENRRQQRAQRGQAGEEEKQLVQELSELKMLRSLQFRVNRRTKQIGRMIHGEQASNDKLFDDLTKLARRQAEIQEATYILATGRNR
jgi:hypothetical protein